MIESYLKRYNWPGNIREMQNVVERMAHLAGDLPLQVKHLPPEIKSTNLDSNLGDGETSSSLTIFEAVGKQKQIRIELERDLIVKLLKQFNNNVSMVAREMGVDRSTIYRKMKRYKIE
jgi:transcriptional regulator of acetoin/glycerol metabolism